MKDLSKLDRNTQNLISEFAPLKQNLDQTRKDLIKEKESRSKLINNALDKVKQSELDYEKKYSSLQAHQKVKIDQMQSQIDSLQLNLNSSKEKINAKNVEYQNLKRKMENLNELSKISEQENADMVLKFEEMMIQKKILDGKISTQDDQIAEYESKIENLKKEMSDQKENFLPVEKLNVELKTKTDSLTKENTNLEQKILKLDQECSIIAKIQSETEENLKRTRKQVEKLESTIQEKSEKIKTLENMVQNAEDMLVEKQAELNSLYEKVETMEDEMNDGTRQLMEKQVELSKLQEDFARLDHQHKYVKNQNASLGNARRTGAIPSSIENFKTLKNSLHIFLNFEILYLIKKEDYKNGPRHSRCGPIPVRTNHDFPKNTRSSIFS